MIDTSLRWEHGTCGLYCCIVRYDFYYFYDGNTVRAIYTAVLYGAIYTTFTMVTRYVQSILLHCMVRFILSGWQHRTCNLYCYIVRYDLYYFYDCNTVRGIYTAVLYGTIYTTFTMLTRYVQSILLHCMVRFLQSRWWHGTCNLYCCIVRYDLYYCHDGCTVRPVYTAVLYGTTYTTVTMVARYVQSILLYCTVRFILLSRWLHGTF